MEETNEVLKQIYSEYPEFFTGDPKYPSMMFGIECGPGWYNIILWTCSELKEYFNNQDPKLLEDFYFTQIKEKFGGLRIYTSFSTNEIEEIISKACKMASVTCEETGEVGKLREINGWYHTVSDEVYNQLLKKFE